ncbi:hypothetical protein V1477_020760 [Vespula maculifrons]|uniref:Uncharacterized protein n=1 Tax=Vespula maculifrons TaxID=7453 RepID=A0ABD2AQL5_VESMC
MRRRPIDLILDFVKNNIYAEELFRTTYYEGSRSIHSYVHSNWVTFQMLDLNIKFLRKYVNLIVCNK